MSGIMVGIDGSPGSALALGWAMKTAATQNAPVTALIVHPVAGSHWSGNPVVYGEDQSEVEQARKLAEEMVQKAASAMDAPPQVTVRAASGIPAAELIDASRDADLVVVGSRGAGGFARLMLGSVGNHVVHHARCPVVVVPFER